MTIGSNGFKKKTMVCGGDGVSLPIRFQHLLISHSYKPWYRSYYVYVALVVMVCIPPEYLIS